MANQRWAARAIAVLLLGFGGGGAATGQGAKENWQPPEPAARPRQVAPERQAPPLASPRTGTASPPTFAQRQAARVAERAARLRALAEAPDRQAWFTWDAQAEGCVPIADQAALYDMAYSTPEQYAHTFSHIVIERRPDMALVADADSQNYKVLAFGVGRAACRAAEEAARALEPPPAPPGTWFAYDWSARGCVPLEEFGLRTPEDLADALRRTKGSPYRVQHRVGGQEGHAVVTDVPPGASDLPGVEVYTAAQERWDCVVLRREVRAAMRRATVVDLRSR